MDHFNYRDGELHAEGVPMRVIAEAVGTPVYIYSRATLERHAQVFKAALANLPRTHIAFAIKANPNLAVLKVLARQGFGADVVSGGEIARALAAGMRAEDIVFSGVGKTCRRRISRPKPAVRPEPRNAKKKTINRRFLRFPRPAHFPFFFACFVLLIIRFLVRQEDIYKSGRQLLSEKELARELRGLDVRGDDGPASDRSVKSANSANF